MTTYIAELELHTGITRKKSIELEADDDDMARNTLYEMYPEGDISILRIYEKPSIEAIYGELVEICEMRKKRGVSI